MHATNQDIKVDKRIGNWVKIGLSLDSYFLFLFFFLIRFRATFQLLFYAVAMLGTTWWKIILKSNLTLSRQRNSERKRRKKKYFLTWIYCGIEKRGWGRIAICKVDRLLEEREQTIDLFLYIRWHLLFSTATASKSYKYICSVPELIALHQR